jgi:AbrB family looped-hinge helix DNA binding protein
MIDKSNNIRRIHYATSRDAHRLKDAAARGWMSIFQDMSERQDPGRILGNGGANGMNLARVSTNGQITVPVEIRRALKIKEGDKVLFYQKPNGEIVINNASLIAIQEALSSVGMASSSEEDVLAEIVRLRYSENSEHTDGDAAENK